jgi:hypothetical protein
LTRFGALKLLFEIGQIVVDSYGSRSIIIEKHGAGYTYYLFYSEASTWSLHRKFYRPTVLMHKACKLFKGGQYGT